METLRLFLNSISPEEQAVYAKNCGTTIGYLRKALSIKQKLDGALARRLDIESGGKVPKADRSEVLKRLNENDNEQSSQVALENTARGEPIVQNDAQAGANERGQGALEQNQASSANRLNESEQRTEPEIEQTQEPSSSDEGFVLGDVKSSRSAKNEDAHWKYHIQTLREDVENAVGKENMQHIQIVSQSEAERPDGARSLNLDGVEGYYDPATRRITLIANNLTSRTAIFVAWHELGHLGIDTDTFKSYRAVLNNSSKNKYVALLADKIMQDRSGADDVAASDRLLAVEEAIVELLAAKNTGDWAHLESKYGMKFPDAFKRNEGSVLAVVMRRLKEILGKLFGVNAKDFSDNQVLELLGLINNSISQASQTTNSGNGDIRFSRVKPLGTSFDDKAKELGGEEAYNKAVEDGKTELSYENWVLVRTPAFKRFFGNWEKDLANSSKVINPKTGEPLVVFHVTDGDFSEFNLSESRANADVQGFYFSSGTEDWSDMGENIMPVFLNIRNPSDAKPIVRASENNAGIKARQQLISDGYDGAIEKEEGMETEYLVLNPNQIKSAVDNNGDFNARKNDIRFSRTVKKQSKGADSDTEYLELANRYQNGDLSVEPRLRELVDDAAKNWANRSKVVDKNGNPKVVYHGTAAKQINEFDYGRIGQQGTVDGQGFYFADTEEFARGYQQDGGSVVKGYLNIQNELSPEKITLTKSNVKKLIQTLDPDGYDYLSNFGDVDYEGYNKVLNEAVNNAFDSVDNDVDLIGGIINAHGSVERVYAALESVKGQSGVIARKDSGDIHYVIGNPNQIKSSELVTYDDNGNIIPLSQRFNSGKRDIRFSRQKTIASNAEVSPLEDITDKFNQELAEFVNGQLTGSHIFRLGKPSDILKSVGVPDLPIELKASKLSEKANTDWHKFDIAEVKGLPNALQNPLAVFSYGDKTKSHNVITQLEIGGKQLLVGVHFNQNRNGLSVNSIRGLFPKDNAEWLNWIGQKDKNGDDKHLYLDKQKIQTLINQQRTNLADVEYLDLDLVESLIQKLDGVNDDENQQKTTAKFSRKRDSVTPQADKTPTVKETIKSFTEKDRLSAIKSFFTEGGKAPQPEWLETLTSLWFDAKAPVSNVLRRFRNVPAGKALEHSMRTYQAVGQKVTDTFLENNYDPMMDTLQKAWKRQFAKHYKELGGDGWKQFLEDISTVGNLVKHGRERNAVILRKTEGKDNAGSGRTNEQIDAIEKALNEQVPGLIEFYENLYKNHLKPMLDYRDKTLQDAGLLTDEMVAARDDYEWYVPLYGDPNEDGMADNGFFHASSPEIKDIKDKKAKGRAGTLADNVIQNVMIASQSAINRAAQQTFLYRLFDFVEKVPAARAMMKAKINTPDTKEIIERYIDKDGLVKERVKPSAAMSKNAIVFRNGNEVKVLEIGNQRVLEALQGLNKANIEGLFALPAKGTRLLSAVYTRYNPMFPLMNKLRDSQSQVSFILADAPVKNPVKAAMKALRYNLVFTSQWRKNTNSDYHIWREKYEKLGGATMYIDLFRDDVMQNISEDFAKGVGATTKHQLKVVGDAVTKVVDGLNEHMEMTSRVSAFKALVESGMTEPDAALYVKNLMNFESRGKYGQQMGAFYSFANAALYDARRMMQSMRRPRGALVMSAHIAMMFMLYGALKALGGDDDDGIARLNKVPLSSSGRFLTFIDPNDPEGKGYKLPVGFGFGRISLTIAAAMHRFLDGVDSKEEFIANVAKEGLAANLSPLEPIDISPTKNTMEYLTQQFAPTMVRPLVQLSQNMTGQGSPIKMPDAWVGEGLKFDNAFPATNRIWRDIAKSVYDATGIDWAPEQFRFLTQSYFGSGAMEIFRGIMLADEKAGTELSLSDIPLGQAFAHKGSRYEMSQFIQKEKEVKRLVAERDYAIEQGRGYEFDMKHPGVMYLSNYFKEVNKELKKLKKERKAYEAITDPAERQRKIKETNEKIRQVQLWANKAVRDYEDTLQQ